MTKFKVGDYVVIYSKWTERKYLLKVQELPETKSNRTHQYVGIVMNSDYKNKGSLVWFSATGDFNPRNATKEEITLEKL